MSIPVEQFEINERTSGRISFLMKDENGGLIPKVALHSLEMWLFEKTRKSIINGRGVLEGAGQDILNEDHGIAIGDVDGKVTWDIQPADTACVLTTPPTTPKADEIHVAAFKATWAEGEKSSTFQLELVITDFVPQVSASNLMAVAAR